MVSLPKIFKENGSFGPDLILPLLPLRDIVIFPHMVAPLFVGRPKSVAALSDAMNNDKRVFLATQKKEGIDNPAEDDISRVGTIGKVLQLLRLPDGTVKALVEGETRGRIVQFLPEAEFFKVELEAVTEIAVDATEITALMRSVLKSFDEYAALNKSISKDLISSVSSIDDPSKLADTLAAHFSFKIEDKQQLLEEAAPADRLSLLLNLIQMEIDIFQMDQRIKSRVKEQMEKTQKNYYLNEQMRGVGVGLGWGVGGGVGGGGGVWCVLK